MKTLIFNGSPRKNGGTAQLINELKNHLPGEVNVIDAYRTDISPCVDCRYCWTHDKCAIDDEMQTVYKLIDDADNIVIASPIYFAELTGPLLSLLSRLQFLGVPVYFGKPSHLTQKRRSGAVILVDGGDGLFEAAMDRAKILLKVMEAEFTGLVFFNGTDLTPSNTKAVPEHIYDEVRELAWILKK